MSKNFLNEKRLNSPLKSPLLRRHFAPIQANISYPPDLFKHSFKQVAIGSDGFFRASVDVHDYRPEEITVKTVGHTVVVELCHGDKRDGFSFVSRKSCEKFVMPPLMDMEKTSSWTSKGVLYVKVPPKESDQAERVVDIKHEEFFD